MKKLLVLLGLVVSFNANAYTFNCETVSSIVNKDILIKNERYNIDKKYIDNVIKTSIGLCKAARTSLESGMSTKEVMQFVESTMVDRNVSSDIQVRNFITVSLSLQ
ncbi:hypothetical protein ESCO3_00020 [Escherichia phage vB_EcoS_ESCO3]|nr:hypothetical protein ESCO3_00020 [Escherichia phage vB_EcoS_ESCO3]